MNLMHIQYITARFYLSLKLRGTRREIHHQARRYHWNAEILLFLVVYNKKVISKNCQLPKFWDLNNASQCAILKALVNPSMRNPDEAHCDWVRK